LGARFDSSELVEVPILIAFVSIVQELVVKVQIGIELARRPEVVRAIGRIARTVVYFVQFQVVQRVNSSHQIALAVFAQRSSHLVQLVQVALLVEAQIVLGRRVERNGFGLSDEVIIAILVLFHATIGHSANQLARGELEIGQTSRNDVVCPFAHTRIARCAHVQIERAVCFEQRLVEQVEVWIVKTNETRLILRVVDEQINRVDGECDIEIERIARLDRLNRAVSVLTCEQLELVFECHVVRFACIQVHAEQEDLFARVVQRVQMKQVGHELVCVLQLAHVELVVIDVQMKAERIELDVAIQNESALFGQGLLVHERRGATISARCLVGLLAQCVVVVQVVKVNVVRDERLQVAWRWRVG